MRILIRLRAEADATYNSTYHHKLRGVFWSLLQNTPYGSMHGDSTAVTFTFSNPFPVGPITKGDNRRVLLASPHTGLVETIAKQLDPGDEFNIGEMAFSVVDCSILTVDVGEPGEKGTLRTDTGVYVRLPQERWDKYGIDPDYNAEQIAWEPDHSISLFLERIRENLEWKHDQCFDAYLQNVTPETELFSGIERLKTYPVTVPVSSGAGYEYMHLVSKWRLEYQVRNEDHRRWLNLLHMSGLGWRNSLGFGFVNKVEP